MRVCAGGGKRRQDDDRCRSVQDHLPAVMVDREPHWFHAGDLRSRAQCRHTGTGQVSGRDCDRLHIPCDTSNLPTTRPEPNHRAVKWEDLHFVTPCPTFQRDSPSLPATTIWERVFAQTAFLSHSLDRIGNRAAENGLPSIPENRSAVFWKTPASSLSSPQSALVRHPRSIGNATPIMDTKSRAVERLEEPVETFATASRRRYATVKTGPSLGIARQEY